MYFCHNFHFLKNHFTYAITHRRNYHTDWQTFTLEFFPSGQQTQVGYHEEVSPEKIQDRPCWYTGTIALGATTASYDLETEIDATFPTEHITPELIEQVREQFVGDLIQAPPLFSAIKKDGKRLYELARKGETTEVPKRAITIHALELSLTGEKELSFKVHCSKGTYIRSLAHDIGKALGSGAHLTSIRRTQIGAYAVAQAYTPEDFVQQFINHPPHETNTIH